MGRYNSFDEDEAGWCSKCGERCIIKVEDEGIGDNEFWGVRSVHHDYVKYSKCCEDDVLDSDPHQCELCEENIEQDKLEDAVCPVCGSLCCADCVAKGGFGCCDGVKDSKIVKTMIKRNESRQSDVTAQLREERGIE